MIIECHTHLSQFRHERHTFSQIPDSVPADMKRLAIGMVLVYPDTEPASKLPDLESTREVVSGRPQLGMLGTARIPTLQAACVHRLEVLAGEGNIVGVRLYPGFETFYPNDEQCQPISELCLRHNLPVVCHSGESMNESWREKYNHPDEIAKVAERFPALKVIIAHFSQPNLAACRGAVLACPNVHADIPGLIHPEVVQRCGQEAILQNLECVATRQAEKILFGSDWPICDVEAHLRLVAGLPIPDKAKDLILFQNAERVFGLRTAW